jgi:hypothetical protein
MLAVNTGGRGINITCPLCRAPSHFESEVDLVVDTELQHSIDLQRGEALNVVACQRCETTEATVDCVDCSAKYCSACSDLVHIGRLRSHHISYSSAAVQSMQKAPLCEQRGHSDYRMDLYCSDCNVLLCVLCSQTSSTHRSHNVIPLKEAADVEKVKLRETLAAAARFRLELRDVSKSLDVALLDGEQGVQEEIAVFDQTVSSLIDYLDRRRAELTERAAAMHAEEAMKVRRTKEQVVHLATKLNDTVSTCQRAIMLSSSVDIITGRVEMERQLAGHAPIVVPHTLVPQIHFPHYQSVVTAVDELAVTGGDRPQAKRPPKAVLEASTIFNERGFKFCKSTYNDVQLLNRGLSALSESRTWETVMCDALLSTGSHYFEVRLDRYDAMNGHNLIIGFVFDGGFELCEVLGEDGNSVGFNCGRGTKSVNGNFMEPYATTCAAGDVVGVKLDFNAPGNIEYYKNGTSMGVAFTGLTRPCYAAISMNGPQQVSLMFPSNAPQ